MIYEVLLKVRLLHSSAVLANNFGGHVTLNVCQFMCKNDISIYKFVQCVLHKWVYHCDVTMQIKINKTEISASFCPDNKVFKICLSGCGNTTY